MSEDEDRLVRMLRQFELEFRGESPVYERLAGVCAQQPALAAPLLAAPWRQRRAILLFGAVQYLLRTVATGHRLATYFPTLGGNRRPDDALADAFADLVAAYGEDLTRLCATRTTQTNEARRAALLRPGLAEAAGGRPLALVELGTSAGLLLAPDRYAYRYHDASRSARSGRADAPAPLVLDCEVRDGAWPEPALAELPPITSRTGIDLNPIDAGDEDAATWLRCLIWPEHVTRLERLDAALAEVTTVGPRMIAGDMVDRLPAAVSEVDDDATLVVLTSHAVTYLPREVQLRLVETLSRLGAQRDLAVVLNEAPQCGIHLFSADAPVDGVTETVSILTLVAWRAGTPSVTSLAHTGPHGAWIAWHPTPLPYRPVSPQ